MNDLVRRAIAVDRATLSLGHEVFVAAGATFVRDRTLPIVHDANHVAFVRAASAEEIDALLARADVEFAHCRHRQVVVDPDTPPAVAARLALDGWEVEASLVMLLEGRLRAAAAPHPIRAVTTEADWAAYARLKRLDWAERAERIGLGPLPEVAEGMIRAARLKTPPLRYWLASVDGEPRGFLLSWEGPEGVGQVEDLFVERPFRRRGLATALLVHGVTDARAHGAGPVVIVSDPTDTPKTMYAAMGFRPVALLHKFTRHDPGWDA